MTETITIPISEYGYAAFSASVPLNFGAVPDCEVYYLPHYNYAELRLKKVKGVAPAHFGVVIAVPKGVRQITVPIATREQAEQCGLSNCDNYFIATDEGGYHVPAGERNGEGYTRLHLAWREHQQGLPRPLKAARHSPHGGDTGLRGKAGNGVGDN